MAFSKEEFEEVVAGSVSISEVCRKLGLHMNASGLKTFKSAVNEYGSDTSHFSHKAAMNKFNTKWPKIEKPCPVCGALFEVQEGHPKEKRTCSHSCSNTFFRSGKNNPNWKDEQADWGYRKRCFSVWPKECAICGFEMVVEVHHIDEDHSNDDLTNLIPLCPNHHSAIHTNKHGVLIKEQIAEIMKEKFTYYGE